MECGDVRERLDALSTGELDLPAREPVEKHLESCVACRQAYVRLRALAAFLRGTPVPSAPAGFASRVAARVGTGDPLRWWAMASVPMRAAAVLVLAAGLLAGALMGWNTGALREDGVPQAGSLETHYGDFLAHAPEASAVQAYLSLVSGPGKEDQ